jgi:dihydropyrimidinase
VTEGRISLERWVELSSTAPARLFGLAPRKGAIAPGADADIVVFDPNGSHRLGVESHHMAVDYSCYEGVEVPGAVRTVLSRGQVVVDNGELVGSAGHGRFVPRAQTSGKLEGGR